MPVAREIYQEGLILPPVRLARRGRIDRDVLAIVLANVRTPDEREGDLSAQIAANRVAETRLRDTVARYGRTRTHALCRSAAGLHRARARRARSARFPTADYEFEDALDDDGFSDGAGDDSRGRSRSRATARPWTSRAPRRRSRAASTRTMR